MSDITDLAPIMKLVEIKNKDKKEYQKMLNDIKEVTKDMIDISMELTKNQRDQIHKEQFEHNEKMKEQIAKKNKEQQNKSGVN
jgi:hypothetical protein